MRKLLFAVAILLVSSSLCAADDLNPPTWRGADGTTTTQWLFGTDDPNPPADLERNPYNREGTSAMMTITGNPLNPNHGWQATRDGRPGVWLLSGEMDAWLWNRPAQLPIKLIWVQITWAEEIAGSGARPFVGEIDQYGTGVGAMVDEVLLGTGPWRLTTYQIIRQPNPPYEDVVINGDIAVDQLVIDTWCVPEPASLGALSFGLTGLLFSRRRRR